MEELRNLKQIYSLAAGRFNQYEGKDFVLPQMFKEQVKEINSNTITYNKYSAVIETKGNQNGVLNIFLPNQWFYIASYFTDFYNELQRYKKEALKVTSKERLKVLNGSTLTAIEENRLNQLSLSEQSKTYLRLFMTNYSWWFGAKTIDRGDFYVSPILNSARLVNASQSFVAELCAFLADKNDLVQVIISGEESASEEHTIPNTSLSFQQIFYGAPGTGKSHLAKEQTQGKQVIRTTFHPDSDYSTFVGSYKPTTTDEEVVNIIGREAVNVKNPDGSPRTEKKIIYEFVPQAFLQAYVNAWKLYAEGNGENPKEQFLIIEEINRGNCAQIFGDLFQLLDRGDDGYSDYFIKADKDLQKYLKKAFGDVEIHTPSLCDKSAEEISRLIKEGEILLLPDNLYIWATMNTSDQSLFPIDSAFKRRWDWKYMPIANEGKGWTIEIGKNTYDWWEFLDKINTKIEDATYSEDKKLGYFFCKAKDGVIDAKTFVGKVLFYLWNDVFKDTDFADSLLKDEDGKKSFDKFYTPIGQGNAEIVTSRIIEFMKRVGVEPIPNFNSEEDEEDEDGKSHVRYSIDGDIFKRKSYAGKEIMSRYLKGHPNLTFQEIKDTFPDSMLVHSLHRGLIASADTQLDSYGRYYSPEQFTSSDGVTFRIYKQWTEANINNIINFAKSQGWNIKVFEESDGSGE